MVGSLFQIIVGFSGLIGLFMRFIGPLTIAPTISLIGLSLFDSAGTSAGYHWGVAIMWVLSTNVLIEMKKQNLSLSASLSCNCCFQSFSHFDFRTLQFSDLLTLSFFIPLLGPQQ